MRKKENRQRFTINMTEEDQKKKREKPKQKNTGNSNSWERYSRHRDLLVLGARVLRQKEELEIAVL